MGRIVAVIAFGICFDVKVGFAYGQYAVVAFAAVSEYLLVVDESGFGESQRRMTCLAHITGSVVIRDLGQQQVTAGFGINAIMTKHALRRQAGMIERTGEAFRRHRGHNGSDRAFGGHATCANLQLQHVNTAHIGDETGIRGVGAFQYGLAARRFMREGPAIGHRFIRARVRFGVIQHHHFTHTNADDGSSDRCSINKNLCACWYGVGIGCCLGYGRISGSA